MPALSRPSVIAVRCRASGRAIAFVTTTVFALATSGCLSNEYRIQKDELKRLAAAPPEMRGRQVRVSQTLGERRSLPVSAAIPEPPAGAVDGSESSGDVFINVNGG